MKTIYVRTIFFSLAILFIFYSSIIYNSEPNNRVGKLNANAQAGKLIFQKYNCISCHQLYGLGGYMGPDLTNVVDKRGEIYTKAFIMNGTSKMPNFHIPEDELSKLIAFLTEISKSGESPVINFEYNIDGTINNLNEK